MLVQREIRERMHKLKGRSGLIQSTSVDSVFRTAFPGVEGGPSLARKAPLNGTPGPLGSRITPGDNEPRRR